MPRSSKSSPEGGNSPRPWLQEKVYKAKLERTVGLVRQSVDSLLESRQRVSISSVEARSKQLDPIRRGVSRSAILNNEEARKYYEQHRTWEGRSRRRPVTADAKAEPALTNIKLDRDENRARQRYRSLTKEKLIDRLLAVERAYAEREDCWERANDELLMMRSRDRESEPKATADCVHRYNFDNTRQESLPYVAIDGSVRTASDQPLETTDMNYHSYFSEIEAAFISRRGKHLLLSPTDWTLIESWKSKGIPLHIVLHGIERTFDSHDAKRQRRDVNSLAYCRGEVEARFGEWLEGQVGVGKSGPGDHGGEGTLGQEVQLPFSREAILKHLSRCRAAYLDAASGQAINNGSELFNILTSVTTRLRALAEECARPAQSDFDELEGALTGLDTLVAQAVRSSLSPDQLTARHEEAERRLVSYRGRTERSDYEQMLDNLILKTLREELGLPRLSLFYL